MTTDRALDLLVACDAGWYQERRLGADDCGCNACGFCAAGWLEAQLAHDRKVSEDLQEAEKQDAKRGREVLQLRSAVPNPSMLYELATWLDSDKVRPHCEGLWGGKVQATLRRWAGAAGTAGAERESLEGEISFSPADWLECLEDMVLQFADRGTKIDGDRRRRVLTTMGLSVLESAFLMLGWKDPHYTDFPGCDWPECEEWTTCGMPTPEGYRHYCSLHGREAREQKEAE
jgi:hypothetical protein